MGRTEHHSLINYHKFCLLKLNFSCSKNSRFPRKSSDIYWRGNHDKTYITSLSRPGHTWGKNRGVLFTVGLCKKKLNKKKLKM